MGMLGFFCAYFYKRIIAFASITGLILTAASYFVMHPKGVYLWIVVGFIFFILARYEKDIDILLIQEGSWRVEYHLKKIFCLIAVNSKMRFYE